jgi:hypothetical protein
MTTKREQILAAVATKLAPTVGAAGRVYRSRQEAFSRNESPAVVIEPGPDNAATEPASTCKIDWSFTLVIAVYARGTIADQVADPVVKSVHSLLMADRSLGGLVMDVWPIGRDPQLERAELAAVWEVLTYLVRYRTSIEDLGV